MDSQSKVWVAGVGGDGGEKQPGRRTRGAGAGGRGQGCTSLQHQPQREAVERGGLGELAVAEAQVASGAELLHRVWEFGGHPGGPSSKWRPPPFPPSLTDQSPWIKPKRRGLGRTATLAGRGRDTAGGGGACVLRRAVVPGPQRTAHARFGADVAKRAVCLELRWPP